MLLTSSYTPRELLRLHGELPFDLTERLVDAFDAAEAIKSSLNYIDEASTCFAEEGFIDGINIRLASLAKTLRGHNKVELLSIIEHLQQIEIDTVRSGEYGKENLDKFIKIVDSLE